MSVNALQAQAEQYPLPPMRLFRVNGVMGNDGTITDAYVEAHGFGITESGAVQFIEVVNEQVDGGWVANTKMRRAFRLWSEIEEQRAYNGKQGAGLPS